MVALDPAPETVVAALIEDVEGVLVSALSPEMGVSVLVVPIIVCGMCNCALVFVGVRRLFWLGCLRRMS
jgi:hypothetical protein